MVTPSSLYHAHVYFDSQTRDSAALLRGELLRAFAGRAGLDRNPAQTGLGVSEETAAVIIGAPFQIQL
jgi:hypothetical protein